MRRRRDDLRPIECETEDSYRRQEKESLDWKTYYSLLESFLGEGSKGVRDSMAAMMADHLLGELYSNRHAVATAEAWQAYLVEPTVVLAINEQRLGHGTPFYLSVVLRFLRRVPERWSYKMVAEKPPYARFDVTVGSLLRYYCPAMIVEQFGHLEDLDGRTDPFILPSLSLNANNRWTATPAHGETAKKNPAYVGNCSACWRWRKQTKVFNVAIDSLPETVFDELTGERAGDEVGYRSMSDAVSDMWSAYAKAGLY